MNVSSNSIILDDVNRSKIWWISLVASGAAWLFGLTMIMISRIHYRFSAKQLTGTILNDRITGKHVHMSRWSKFRLLCQKLAAGQNVLGKTFLIFSFIMSAFSLAIYIDLAYRFKSQYSLLYTTWTDYPLLWADLSFNIFFFLFLIIRLVADNTIIFFFHPVNIADIVNIAFIIVSLIIDTEINGFRFLRALRIVNLSDILVYLSILRSQSIIRLMNVICIFIAVWFGGAGFIHLLENIGDWWIGSPIQQVNSQQWAVYDCIYYIMVTMSTVGYGDMCPKTNLGRLFIIIYIIVSLSVFASSIPEIIDIMKSQKLYSGSYDVRTGQRHIIVTGYLDYKSIRNFLKEFLHPDRPNNVKVVFLGSLEPDLKTLSLLKRKSSQVKYFQGSVSRLKDLNRVSTQLADAVIILSNLQADDPDEMDWTSVMRVIAVKDAFPDMKIIVQILLYKNKAYLRNIPNWHHSVNDKNADQVICLSELKMGLIAQSCIAPGFSTLMTNLVTITTTDITKFKKKSWQTYYARGADFEMYRVNFSKDFENKTFTEAASICLSKLDIMLLAVEIQWTASERRIFINPHNSITIKSSSMIGLVITSDTDRAHRLMLYCETCHVHDLPGDSLNLMPCFCKKNNVIKNVKSCSTLSTNMLELSTYDNKNEISDDKIMTRICRTNVILDQLQSQTLYHQNTRPVVDSTGLFHYCNTRSLDEATLTYQESVNINFKHHIIVCLLATPTSPAMGLCNFVMPLRSSYISFDELQDIVIVGDCEFVRNEWTTLQNFPRLYLLQSSPLNRAFLRAVDLENCAACVILSATPVGINQNNSDITLVDKEAVLCTLNIKTMHTRSENKLVKDHVFLITELHEESNVNFLDQDDDPNINEIFMSQPYASGHMFNTKLLDSIISTTFFNSSSVNFLQELLSGSSTGEVEAILADGLGLLPGVTPPCRLQCRILQLDIDKSPLCNYMNPLDQNTNFGELFQRVLRETGIICIGIYRCEHNLQLKNLRQRKMSNLVHGDSNLRFVLASPQKEIVINRHDKIFCLKPLSNLHLHVNNEENANSNDDVEIFVSF